MSLASRSPNEVVQAIRGFLDAATWGDEPAFERVAVFDQADIVQALKDLTIHESRVALIIYIGDRWDHLVQKDGQRLVSKRVTQVTIIVSDRIIGDRVAAVVGGLSNPGAITLQEIAIDAACGDLFQTTPYVLAYPTDNEPIFVQGAEAASPGRAAMSIDIECVVDWGDLHG